jgi:hypothetical protein
MSGGPKRRPHLDVGDEVERHFQPFARLSQLSAFVPPRLRFLFEHPERVRRREFPFGNATVFDAEVTVDARTAAVMLRRRSDRNGPLRPALAVAAKRSSARSSLSAV